MRRRAAQAGVTLIEMLAALAVTALIGVAGFAMLDTVIARDAQLRGRFETIRARDRAFRLLMLDAGRAHGAELSDAAHLQLALPDGRVTWLADADGVRRRLDLPGNRMLTQAVLDDPARLTRHDQSPRAVVLTLTGPGISKVFPLSGDIQ
ncbi:MAG: PulJ/GspJ family protein [Marinibacterium sp.]